MFINNAPISKNQSKKLALLIGIEYTNTDNYLPGCIGDVVEMYNMLVNIYNIHPHNIIQLTDTNKIKPTRTMTLMNPKTSLKMNMISLITIKQQKIKNTSKTALSLLHVLHF